MSVNYRRTFNLTYSIGETITDDDKASFFNYLKEHQLFTTCNEEGQEIEYGTKIKQDEKTVYQIWFNPTTMQGTPVEYRMEAEAIVETFHDLYPEIKYEERTTVGNVEEMFLPKDRALVFGDSAAISLKHTKPSNQNEIVFEYGDDEITMNAVTWFHTYGGIFDLDFSINYRTKSVIRDTDIEKVLTDIPNSAMGFIQARVEEALETFVNGVPTPSINCNFECINSSRSECNIEIVNKTRDARNEFRSEEE